MRLASQNGHYAAVEHWLHFELDSGRDLECVVVHASQGIRIWNLLLSLAQELLRFEAQIQSSHVMSEPP